MHQQRQKRPSLEHFLQEKEVQERIQRDIERVRLDAAVSIGNAATLFEFTENQLRDWENRKLIEPFRKDQREGAKGQRHRQYSMRELEKLAIIKELLKNDYTPGEILSNMTVLQRAVSSLEVVGSQAEIEADELDGDHQKIDIYLDDVYAQLFWRYYISQALRLVFLLICEDRRYVLGGILLPMTRLNDAQAAIKIEDLADVGPGLVGWLGRSGSFYTFTTPEPAFEFASDYRIASLKSLIDPEEDQADLEGDQTFLLLERRMDEFKITHDMAVTAKRVLAPIYDSIAKWRTFFEPGRRDETFPTNDFGSRVRPPDLLLSKLADLVVDAGGEAKDGSQRWDYCCLLLPHDILLPPRQQKLVVQAQSSAALYRLGIPNPTPHNTLLSVSGRAFLSGRVVFREELVRRNALVVHTEFEEPMRSALAVPIGAENGKPLGVLYVASRHPKAFDDDDQRFLRMIGRIVEDLLLSYQVRQRVSSHLKLIVNKPAIVDTLFEDFFSEQDFVYDVASLLKRVNETHNDLEAQVKEVSFIAIDVDQHSRIARVYSTALVQNLVRKIGLAIEGLMRTVFMQNKGSRLYYIYADRFYLVLDNVSLEDARDNAVLLKRNLAGSHKVAISRGGVTDGGAMDGVIVPDVRVRIGVTSYTYATLVEIMGRTEPPEFSDVQAQINASLKESLKKGTDEGGDVVISWDRTLKIFKKWDPDISNGINK
ncbi:MAG TPA: GAF domain-containing protein [Ktedonobacteraceae bacterium]|nr:GAF domain-containing protein [Ktedonobacteraceae bacterium]